MKSNSSLLFETPNTLVRKDINNRILFNLYEKKRQLLKKERANLKVPLFMRLQTQQLLNTLPGSPLKINNRCMLTGRCRGISRHFKLSRIMIKELSSYGLLPGIIKSSW